MDYFLNVLLIFQNFEMYMDELFQVDSNVNKHVMMNVLLNVLNHKMNMYQ